MDYCFPKLANINQKRHNFSATDSIRGKSALSDGECETENSIIETVRRVTYPVYYLAGTLV
jgi:hypothetical protein